MLSFAAGSLNIRERDALVDSQLTRQFLKLVLEDVLQVFLSGVLQHLRTPILIDNAQVLQVKLLDHEDGQSVVSELQQKLDDILRLELLQLGEGDRSGKVWRVTHLRQDNRVFDEVDVPIRIKLCRVAELLGEGSCREQVLKHINVVVLVLGRLKQSFDTAFQLLVELANDRVGLRVVIVDRFLGVVELGGRIDRGNGKGALG